MKNLVVITARGGSKRIPRKNTKIFCGKPILSYSIDAAISSGLFEEVMVSTDDLEIAEIAKSYGAKVPFLRSKENSDDFSTTADVLVEVLSAYKKVGKTFENIACIYPTAPFVTSKILRDAAAILEDCTVDSVMPIVRFSFPPQRGFLEVDGMISYQNPQYERARSQDLQPIYHDCGQFYFIQTDVLLEKKSLITQNTKGMIVDELSVQDIDTISDWEIAELKYQLLMERENKHE